MSRLADLAKAAGLDDNWTDVFGNQHEVSPDTLRAVLDTLGLAANSEAQIRDSREHLREQQTSGLPVLITATVDTPVPIRLPDATKVRIMLEGSGYVDAVCQDGCLPGLNVIGYHSIETADYRGTLAIAPPRAVTVADLSYRRAIWGLAAQLYALRRPNDGGVGDFTALADLVRAARRHGADAIAVSPIHALFAADPTRFSPYAPSSRLLLNWLHVDAGLLGDPTDQLHADPLVNWPESAVRKRAALRALYEQCDAGMERNLATFRAQRGEALEHHARFEALQAHLYAQDPSLWHWRAWPAEYRDPASSEVARFAAEHTDEVDFHIFLQFLADRGLAQAQGAARECGMAIGLISDLAVGTDSSGSHCWSRQQETLIGLSVGAPPDLLAPQGQDWGLTAFSPRGLALNGFRAFIEMLRATLRHAGGVRIDHAMSLARLWVLPHGASPTEGAYLRFPTADLLRLVTLESARHNAIVLGEDLGTVPEGFSEKLAEAGIAGMRVLFFERVKDWFRPPSQWTRGAVAMTSTHDLPTVAGWWEGKDLDLRTSLGLLPNETKERAERNTDRKLLWHAFRDSGAALHSMPPVNEGQHAAGSAVVHVGKSACCLALVPLEDILALRDQPNLPGTTDEHPNWRRRLPGNASEMLDAPEVTERLSALDAARKDVE